MRMGGKIAFLLLIEMVLLSVSCEKDEIKNCREKDYIYDNNPLCERLNQNVEFYAELVRIYRNRGEFLELEFENSTYFFTLNNGKIIKYNVFVEEEDDKLPLLSIKRENDFYYWTINGEEAKDEEGNRVVIDDIMPQPMFRLINNRWEVTWDGRKWKAIQSCAKKSYDLNITYSSNEDFIIFDINDTLQLIIPSNKWFSTLKREVPNQGFYKDVFLDAGVYLTTRNSLAAASFLGYTLESVSCTNIQDTLWQNNNIAGCQEDENGRLLYPDGAPRYRLLFVCGGNSRNHGKTLRPKSRERMRDFVKNGGSYVGTCAGAFFVSNGYDDVCDYQYYLGLWPGMVSHTGLLQTYTGMFVDAGSPLLDYYDFGGDHYVNNIRHNKGGMPSNWPEGTEVLARYDYPLIESMHEQPSAWAYKKNNTWGRIIMEGSHPEEVSSGERCEFTAAMLRYAADGIGETTIKGLLRNGEVRKMDKTTGDNKTAYTRIGDMQYHHFAVYIPKDAKNIKFTISSEIDCDLQLSLHSTTFAYSDIAEYKSKEKGHYQELLFDGMSEGLWYVSVRCLTTVESTDVPLGQVYSGKLEVLNGIPYSVSVTWN